MDNQSDQFVPSQRPRGGGDALKWNYLGNISRALSQFVIGIVLARLLGPAPFGTIAAALLVISLGSLCADLGFGAALIQRPQVTRRDLRFVFTCQLLFALLLSGVGIASASHIAAYFQNPQTTAVIQVMFLLFVVQAFGQTAAAMLRRALDFKTLQQITIVSSLAGYLGVGVPGALLGLEVWSLVAAQLVQAVLHAALLLRAMPVPLKPYFSNHSPEVVKFGLKVAAANLSSWNISNLDSVFVGRAFGVIDLGLYVRTLNLLSAPMNIITTGFQGVLFSVCARLQHQPEKLKRIYLETNAAVAMVCCPIFLSTAVLGDTLMVGIYGARWQASAPLILPLSLAVLTHTLLCIKGPILMAANRVGLELRNQLYTLVLFLPLLLLASHISLVALAWSVFATFVLRWLLLTLVTMRLTGASTAEFGASLRLPLLIGAAVACAVWCMDRALQFMPALPRLLMVGAAGATLVLLLARVAGAWYLRHHLDTLVDLERLSGLPRRFLNLRLEQPA